MNAATDMRTLEMPFLFVIGAPRSGTSWLHQMLAAHPSIAAMESEELTVFSRYLAPWSRNFQLEIQNNAAGKWRQGLPCLLSEQEFDASMLGLVDQVYTKLRARNPQATHLLDKHPNYSKHLPLIDRLLPQSRFIHIIRDGREVAVSMMSVRKRVGHSPGEVRGAAREWYRCLTMARADGERLGPQRYLEVRYESLMKDTATELERVLRFSGLPVDPAFVERISKEHHISVRQVSKGDATLNALRAQPGAIWREKMSVSERWIFDRMVGGLLNQLGYAEPGWWATSASDRLRMLPYGVGVRLKRSLEPMGRAWSGPLEEKLA